MDMGYILLLNKIETDISERHDCNLSLAFICSREWKLGRWQVFTLAGGVKITLTLSTGAANMSGFSLASLLYCATQLSCSNVITSTTLAIPGQSTHIKEAFNTDLQTISNGTFPWPVTSKCTSCLLLAVTCNRLGCDASGSPWPIKKANPQPFHSDKQGQGPCIAVWLFVDALHGLKPMCMLSSHPDKMACDEFHRKSSKEKQCE